MTTLLKLKIWEKGTNQLVSLPDHRIDIEEGNLDMLRELIGAIRGDKKMNEIKNKHCGCAMQRTVKPNEIRVNKETGKVEICVEVLCTKERLERRWEDCEVIGTKYGPKGDV